MPYCVGIIWLMAIVLIWCLCQKKLFSAILDLGCYNLVSERGYRFRVRTLGNEVALEVKVLRGVMIRIVMSIEDIS